MYDIVVVGGGAAGMTAALFAAERGARVLVAEKNAALGRKLSITGKGRCNLTNNCDIPTFMENVPNNGRFLYSALSAFSPSDTMELFERLGVPLKTERGRRVFPVSDKAGDVVSALERGMRAAGAQVAKENVRSLVVENGICRGVNTQNGQILSKAVIIAAGGASYPKTGSDGSGYRLARQAGHTVVPPVPSLCPLVTEEKTACRAAGLTLKNVAVTLLCEEKPVFEDFGELSFTQDGVGGAVTLSASAHIFEPQKHRYSLKIDLKPALSEERLDARILRDFGELRGKTFAESLRKLLPAELCEPFAEIVNIPYNKKISEITKIERKNLVKTLKNFTLTIKDFRPIDEAVVTRGGVSVKEISPKTMQSALCGGLFFAGEIIDVDAYTGGFNLQIAFSTGRLAGLSAADFVKSI